MNITVRSGRVLEEPVSLAVVAACEGEPLEQAVSALIEPDDFSGKSRQMMVLYPRDGLPARRVLLMGLGKRDKLDTEALRQVAARASQKAHALKLPDMALQLPELDHISPDVLSQAVVEGVELGLYRFLDHKSSPSAEESHRVEHLTLFAGDSHGLEAVQQGATTAQAIARGVNLARDLANGPGNVVTPAYLGDVAQDMGTRFPLDVSVLQGEALNDFGGLLAVGQGSSQSPCFLVLEYGAALTDAPTVCLVGKGITFDTGGISIKPSQGMEDMKMDMGGAAALLGTMQAVAELGLPMHIVGLVAAAENMLGPNAYRPGDIIKTLSGQTVEVLNTDAEGRIVLADALFYAQRYQPEAMIDVATLTGAITVALGPHAIGLMGNDPALVEHVSLAGDATGERVWQLPLWDDYKDLIKSDIADMKNVPNGRVAGSIAAAAFLSAFVGDYPWAHLDIAGTAWCEKPLRDYHTKPGATGVGVRLLVHVLQNWVNT